MYISLSLPRYVYSIYNVYMYVHVYIYIYGRVYGYAGCPASTVRGRFWGALLTARARGLESVRSPAALREARKSLKGVKPASCEASEPWSELLYIDIYIYTEIYTYTHAHTCRNMIVYVYVSREGALTII